MNNVNRADVRKWLFEHSQVLGHRCDSVKSKDLDESTSFIRWIDKNWRKVEI